MNKRLALILALSLAVLPVSALALGLGDIQLHSALNQPMSADISVVGVQADDLDTLKISIAADADFKRAGLDYPLILDHFHFAVVAGPNNTATIKVTSDKPVKEPLLDFLIEADWASGRVVREYTLLLNPPNLGPSQAAVQTPVATTQPAQTTAIPAQQSATGSEQPIQTAGSALPSGSYGPIKRGETLSGIARRLSAGTKITLNQMMMALYRANPDAFMGNINRMKSGYTLQIPDSEAMQALSAHQATMAVHKQIVAWRGSAQPAAKAVSQPGESQIASGTGNSTTPAGVEGNEAHLQLVAPGTSTQGAGATPGTGTTASGGQSSAANAAALSAAQQELADANQQNADLQTKVGELQKQLQETKRLLSVKDSQLAALQNQAKSTAAVKTTPSTTQFVSSAEGILGWLTTPFGIIAVAIVLVLLVVAFLILRRNRAARLQVGHAEPVLNDDDWMEHEEADIAAQAASAGAGDGDQTASHTEGGEGGPHSQSEAGAKLTDTVIGGTPIHLDESDPIAEADFHMAYGLYDQAADLIKKAINQEPARRDLKLKLLDIYFATSNRDAFVEVAHELHNEMGGQLESDWDNVAIMGRQLAPDDKLFSEEASASHNVDVDLAPMGEGDETAGATTSHHDLDYDMSGLEIPESGSTVSKASAEGTGQGKATATAGGGGLEFDLENFEFDTESPAPAAEKTEKPPSGSFTDTQTEFEKAINELSAFVDTNAPSGGDAATLPRSTAMDEGMQLDTGQASGEGADIGEIGTKLDLAKAYIDMGDSDGARSILEEVLDEGDDQQKQEAQELLGQLS